MIRRRIYIEAQGVLEAPEELALGDLDGPETGQMSVLDLAVKEHVAPALETLDEVDEANLEASGMRLNIDFMNAPAQSNAVETSGQLAAPVRLDAVGLPELGEGNEGAMISAPIQVSRRSAHALMTASKSLSTRSS